MYSLGPDQMITEFMSSNHSCASLNLEIIESTQEYDKSLKLMFVAMQYLVFPAYLINIEY